MIHCVESNFVRLKVQSSASCGHEGTLKLSPQESDVRAACSSRLADTEEILSAAWRDRYHKLKERAVTCDVGDQEPVRGGRVGVLLNGVDLVGGGLEGETEIAAGKLRLPEQALGKSENVCDADNHRGRGVAENHGNLV